MIEAHVKEN